LVEVGSESDRLEQLDEFFEHVAESDDVHGPLPAVELKGKREEERKGNEKEVGLISPSATSSPEPSRIEWRTRLTE